MRLRWVVILIIFVLFFAFVLWFRPFGPAIENMAPNGTELVVSFSNPAETMEILDRAGVFSQVVEFYKIKPLPTQVQLALMSDRLIILLGKVPSTNERFLIFAFDYGPAARLFRLKEKAGLYRAGELICLSEKVCAAKLGRYMLAGTQAGLESYISVRKKEPINDPAKVENLKTLSSRGEIALFLLSFDPITESLKKVGDFDLSLLVDSKSFAGLGIFGDIDETGIQISGEIFSRTGKPVLKLEPTAKLPLLEPTKTAISLSFNIGSRNLFERLFAKTLNVPAEGDDAIAKLRKMVLESFVSTLSGKAAAALTKEGTAWALELSRPEEMRSYLALLKRNITGDSEFDTERLELTFQDGKRTAISEGKWLVIGSDKDSTKTLLEQIKKADVGGPYALWTSFWTPGVATDGPTMIYIYGPNSNFIKGYVPKAMVPRFPLAKEISRSKHYKLAVHSIYYTALAFSVAMIILSGYKLLRLSRSPQEPRPSSKKV